jgi:hypothetical protein
MRGGFAVVPDVTVVNEDDPALTYYNAKRVFFQSRIKSIHRDWRSLNLGGKSGIYFDPLRNCVYIQSMPHSAV